MTEFGPLATRRGFWRCRACGAPNPSRSYQTRCLGCGEARPVEPEPVPEVAPVHSPLVGSPFRTRLRRGALWATYAYAALVLFALVLIRWVGDAWWGVVLVLFLPRWLFLAPVAVLMAASGWARKPSHWPLQAAIALVVAGPLMAFSVPVARLGAGRVAGERFRLLSYNRGDGTLDVDRLSALLDREQVDLICFQEGSRDDPTLNAYLQAHGWHVDQSGYVASRHPVFEELPPLIDEAGGPGCVAARLHRARVRTASGTEFILASVHLPTLRPGFYRFLDGDVPGLEMHIAWWRHELDRVVARLPGPSAGPLLVAGDFNMPADDSTMAALRGPFRFGFEEAGWGYGYTRPTRHSWVRIDHVLTSPEWRVTRCRVGPDCGSDHLPVLADLVLPVAN